MTETVETQIQELAALIERQSLERLTLHKLDCEANRINCKTTIKPGKKYVKVDIGPSGRLMIDSEGNIFGIKAYGVIHRGHPYGTLDTIDQWYWGDYAPARKIEVTQ